MKKTSTFRRNFFILLAFIPLVALLTEVQTSHAQNTCHLIFQNASVPANFGSPYDFIANTMGIYANCVGPSATISAGTGLQTSYAYELGYIWNGSNWQQFTFTPTSAKSGSWIVARGTHTLTAQPSVPLYFVAYICSWDGSAWKCGCRDRTCATSYWQLQAIAAPPIAGNSSGGFSSTSSGGGSSSSGGSTSGGGSNSGGGASGVGTGEPGSRGFGGPYAPWNIPAKGLPTAPNSASQVNLLYQHTSGRFNLNTRLWTIQLRDTSGTTGQYEVVNRQPSWGNMHGKRMPWNPSWGFSNDGDAYVVVVDYNTGRSWEIWGHPSFTGGKIHNQAAVEVKRGVKLNANDQPANILTKENGFEPSGAVGLPRAFMLVTREEIENGYIPHAVAYTFHQPARGKYVPPATKGAGPMGGAANRLPMGVRVVWDLTDQEIDAWVNTLQPSVRKGMRAFAVALRDYGAIGVDHGGNGNSNPPRGTMGNMEHDFTAKWDEIGFSKNGTFRALDSLLSGKKNKARVIRPCEFAGGNKNNTCCYPNNIVNYPQGHQCNP